MTDSEPEGVVGRLGSRIRAERQGQGLTVAELSNLSGVGRATVSELEQAARTPTLDTLAKIATGLGVPMPTLLEERRPGMPLESFAPGSELEVRVLGIWIEDDVQVEVYRLRLSGPLRRGRSRPGSRGYLTVISGTLSAGSAATPRHLTAGSQLAFAADQPHALLPDGDAEVVLVMRYPIDIDVPDPAEPQPSGD
ncbi:helix-turn-helix domain-containing protein [Mobilicoccus caccae]|uniref:HTH cro/C1-type domain-containing protein n=1 Tax=Mobilicoccus caccae TaxID=1859295 RepID=A0ABQ6IWV4_9MICO|nr:helix-turn-helix transcriptional regulator [Mobilicoccus caccae]GMA41551.1 hypothetical protein GCM10025883_35960 [Mobilicoccus caccae]